MIAFRIQSRKKRKKITGSHSAAKILLHAKYQVLVVMDPLHRISFTCPPRAANAPMRRFPTAPAAPMTSTDILAFGGETRWGDPVDFAFINLQLMFLTQDVFLFQVFWSYTSQKVLATLLEGGRLRFEVTTPWHPWQLENWDHVRLINLIDLMRVYNSLEGSTVPLLKRPGVDVGISQNAAVQAVET